MIVAPASLLILTLAAQSPQPKEVAPPAVKETVVVTGVAAPVPLEEADRAVRVFPVALRDRLVAATVLDFLRLDPSLDLRARAAGGVQTDLSIRGSSFGQTLVLLNGLRLNDVQSGHHNLNLPVPMESVSAIEVLRGSGSAYYGSDAVGGAVNLITAAPEGNELRLRAGAGNFGVNQQAGALDLLFGKVTQQFAFSRDFSTGFREDRDYRNLTLSSSTWLRTRKLGTTSVLLAHNDRPFGADQFYGNYNSWERTKAWFASIRQDLGERTQAAFGYRRHTDLFVLYRDRPQVYTNRHATESYQGAFRRRESITPTATFNWGLEGYRDSIVSNNLGNHQRDRGAAYASLDWRALRRFSFTLAGREELYTGGNRQFTPAVSAGYWIDSHWKLRASASRAYRLPTYTDLYYRDPATRGNPNLRPEQAWSYDGGLDWYGGPSQTLHGEVNVFQRRERDGIDYVRRSPSDLWEARNFQRLHFTGVEASMSLRFQQSRQTLDFRYTGLRGAQQITGADVLLSRYIFNYPVHQGVVAWQGQIAKGWITRARLGVLDRLGRDPYTLADLYIARAAGRWNPFVQFTNLGDTRYQEIAGVPMQGRAFVAGIAWRLPF